MGAKGMHTKQKSTHTKCIPFKFLSRTVNGVIMSFKPFGAGESVHKSMQKMRE
jgi:hypothetical protein